MKKFRYIKTKLDNVYETDLYEKMNILGAQGYRVVKVKRDYYYDSGSRSGMGDYTLYLEKEYE